MLRLDLILTRLHMDDLVDIKALDEVLGDDVRRPDDNIVDINHRESHQ